MFINKLFMLIAFKYHLRTDISVKGEVGIGSKDHLRSFPKSSKMLIAQGQRQPSQGHNWKLLWRSFKDISRSDLKKMSLRGHMQTLKATKKLATCGYFWIDLLIVHGHLSLRSINPRLHMGWITLSTCIFFSTAQKRRDADPGQSSNDKFILCGHPLGYTLKDEKN